MIAIAFHSGNSKIKWSVSLLFILCETILLYAVPRSNFIATYSLFLVLFALYLYILKKENFFSLSTCIWLAVGLRVIAIFCLPVLSDDYFRFIWDGKMCLASINPFRYTPQEYLVLHKPDQYLQYLYTNMNSVEYHTIYPPVMQYIFSFSVWLFPSNAYGSMVVMKIFIFLSECITMRVLYLFAKSKEIPVRNILWYILNPLIIIELTGNVHFDAVMLCFLVSCLYLLHKKAYLLSAICWALAISTKLIPLVLAPVLLCSMGLKRFFSYGSVASVLVIILFLPFFNIHLVQDINTSFTLFYHLFEFNASIFYLIRTIAFHYVDYDIIEEVAPNLGLLSLLIILIISCWRGKSYSLETKCMWVYSVYFLFSTMVHPWYSAILILFSVFSRYKFPVVFSMLILLSYFPYSLKDYDENMGVILIEYALLLGFIVIEIRSIRKKGKSPLYLHSEPIQPQTVSVL